VVDGFCAVRRGKRVIFLADELVRLRPLDSAQGHDGQADEERNRLADSVARVTGARQLTSTGAWRGRSGKLSVVRTRLEGAWVVVRRFTHGGILGGILPEITFGRARILHELEAVNWARAHDVPTPRIVATSLQSSFGPFYRAHVITEEVAGACNMTEFFLRLPSLSAEMGNAHKRAAMEALGRVVSSMHAAGILHGDLHLRNVLVRIASDKAGVRAQGYLLDFDRARIVPNVTRRQRLRNLRRLMRSVWKVQPARDRFTARDGILFLRAYLGETGRVEVKQWFRRLSQPPWLHRLWWAVPKGTRDARLPGAEGIDES
jgi:tRNA A-37 threonylcarbamoyl transferase component Bud32